MLFGRWKESGVEAKVPGKGSFRGKHIERALKFQTKGRAARLLFVVSRSYLAHLDGTSLAVERHGHLTVGSNLSVLLEG